MRPPTKLQIRILAALLVAQMVILLIALLIASAAAETPTARKIEPLATAYRDLIATDEQLAAFERMTEVQRLARQLEQLTKAAKECRNKTYSVRLRVTAVVQPFGPQRLLVHGQYVDPEQIKLFGKDANVGIWTDDAKTAAKLSIDDEIELRGKIFYGVGYFDRDVARIKEEWKEKDLNIGVACLHGYLTGWLRGTSIFMVNPRIVPVQTQAESNGTADGADDADPIRQ